MEYIIWGCGNRGRVLALMLGKNNVSAFVDKDDKLIGTKVYGIPVISFDNYLEIYKGKLVLVAAKGAEATIGEILDSHMIPWIAIETAECTSILNQIRLSIEKIIVNVESETKYVIYGLNIYGIMLYELLKKYEQKCVFFFQKELPVNLEKYAYKYLPISNAEEKCERVFLSMEDHEATNQIISNNEPIRTYEIYKYLELFRNPELKKFHNIYQGKRCFIIANGPSLRMEDLDKLYQNHELCFGVNGIFKAFPFTKWRPDFYHICDIYGFLPWKEDIMRMNVKEKFISDSSWWFDDDENIDGIHRFHDYMEYKDKSLPHFSEDVSECCYWGGSVIYNGSLQMAAYMGFKEIYMLGADCTVEKTEEEQHFVKDYSTKQGKAYGLNVKQLFVGYEAANRYAKKHGIKLCNATRGGALEVLERVNFDDLF